MLALPLALLDLSAHLAWLLAVALAGVWLALVSLGLMLVIRFFYRR